MKTKLAITCLIAGIALAPLAYAEDSDTDRDHPKAFVKDSVITTKIKSSLAAQHITSLARIHVDTDASGNVWIDGIARSQAEIDQTVLIAQGTEGVKSVKNGLTIQKDE